MNIRYVWTTQNEIDFIKGLGTHRVGAPRRIEDVPLRERLRLLKNYKKNNASTSKLG